MRNHDEKNGIAQLDNNASGPLTVRLQTHSCCFHPHSFG